MTAEDLAKLMRKDTWQQGPMNCHALDRKTLARIIWDYRKLYSRNLVLKALRWLRATDSIAQPYFPTKHTLIVEYEESAEPSWCWTVLDNRGVIYGFGWKPTEAEARKHGEEVVKEADDES
jgi:hypothetical protein